MNDRRWCLILPPEGAARTVCLHAADAFNSILDKGCCKIIDSAPYLQGYAKMLKLPDDNFAVDLFNQSCAIACLDFQVTHCLVGALAPVTLFTLRLLQKYHVITGLWFYEDYYKAKYWQSVLSGYNHFFAIQHGLVETSCKESNVKFHFLPTASGCGNYPYDEHERRYDAVFIGLPSTYRIAVLEHCAQSNIRLALAGAGWNTYHGILEPYIVNATWIEETDAFQLMQQSRIGINLSFDNPTVRTDVQLSPRIFDYAAAGCVIVTEETPILRETLPDITVHTFNNSQDTAAVIASLCNDYHHHTAERTNNRAVILANHQYVHRVAAILQATDPIG
jgi:hypothetical protein